jgi:drug/metabolite transporter (DMT)-like permease
MIGANISNAGLSLGAAGSWGTADFVGGLASRRSSVIGVLLVTQLTGFCGLVVLALLTHEPFPSRAILLWGLAGGVTNIIGFVAFYGALAVGKMGINAPVTAVITGAMPVLYSLITEGWPRGLQMAGFLIALIGIWLLAKPDSTGIRSEGLGLAIIAGFLFSAFLILIKIAGQHTTAWPLASARFAGLVVAGTLVVSRRGDAPLPARSSLPLAIIAGLLDSGGTVFFLPAARHGRLDVAVVLSSLYPLMTVVLARIILKERLTAVQAAGVIAALAAVPMIAS